MHREAPNANVGQARLATQPAVGAGTRPGTVSGVGSASSEPAGPTARPVARADALAGQLARCVARRVEDCAQTAASATGAEADAGTPAPAMPAPRGGPLLQRKVGFEFESGDWSAWRYGGTREPPGRDEPNNYLPSMLHPAKRQETMHTGTGFELQADDTPGPTLSNIELVTKPITTDGQQGMADLNRTLHLMEVLMSRIEQFPDRRRTNDSVKDRYIFPEESGLNIRRGYYLSSAAGAARTKFKMQATAGIRLKHLPQVMEYFGKVQGETAQQALERDPARKLIMREPGKQRHTISLPAAKPWATAACHRIEQAYLAGDQHGRLRGVRRDPHHAQHPFATRRDDLIGFLAAVMVFLYNMSQDAGEAVKYNFVLFGRNDFQSMFLGIDAHQRAVFAQRPELLVDSVIDELNASAGLPHQLTRDSPVAANAKLKVPNTEEAIARGAPMNKWHSVMGDTTIWRWLGVVAKGGADFMTPRNIEAYLRFMAQHSGERTDIDAFRQKVEHHKQHLESVGVYGSDTSTGGDDVFLFENRALVNPWWAGNMSDPEVTLDEAGRIARSYLQFFIDVEQGVFGQFPQY